MVKHSKYINRIESESIYVLREAVSQFERPAILFSGGKDSICMAHIARKAFFPGKIPFPFLHIDTGHNFVETIKYRDCFVKKYEVDLIVKKVQESIDSGRVREEIGHNPSRNSLQTVTLLDSLKELKIDCAIGGARRDEEKSRAKERFFSYRNVFGSWEPRSQRPEIWGIFNGRKNPGEHFRVFPLSNWTEIDIWEYIQFEEIKIPSLYFSHKRPVIEREGMILAAGEFVTPNPSSGEKIEDRNVRFRTIGDMTCTGAFESLALTVQDIISEITRLKITERGGRIDDRRSETSMEDRKKQGYF